MHEIKHLLRRQEKRERERGKKSPHALAIIGHVDLHCVLLLHPKATVNGVTLRVDFKSDYSVHFPANRSENTHV